MAHTLTCFVVFPILQYQKMAAFAEEVHREAFLRRKAKGDDLSNARIPFSKETRQKMVDMYPEGSADRDRIERIIKNEQAVLNIFSSGDPKITTAGGCGWWAYLSFLLSFL